MLSPPEDTSRAPNAKPANLTFFSKLHPMAKAISNPSRYCVTSNLLFVLHRLEA